MKLLKKYVGQMGEFTDRDGNIRQCVVTQAPDRYGILVVDYVIPELNKRVTGAMIDLASFRPDK